MTLFVNFENCLFLGIDIDHKRDFESSVENLIRQFFSYMSRNKDT